MGTNYYSNFCNYLGSMNIDFSVGEDVLDRDSVDRIKVALRSNGEYIVPETNNPSHTADHTAERTSLVDALDNVICKTSRPATENYHSRIPTDSLYSVFPNEQIQWSQALEVLGVASNIQKSARDNLGYLQHFLENASHGDKLGLTLNDKTVDCGTNCISRGFVSMDGFIRPVSTDKCCTAVLIRDLYDKHFGFGIQTIYPGISRSKDGEPMEPRDAVRFMNVYNKDLTEAIRKTDTYKCASLMEKVRLVTSGRTNLLSNKERFDPDEFVAKPRTILERTCYKYKNHIEKFVIHKYLKDGSELRCYISELGISVNRSLHEKPQTLFVDRETGQSIEYVSLSEKGKTLERFSKIVPNLYNFLCEIDRIIAKERQLEQEKYAERDRTFETLFETAKGVTRNININPDEKTYPNNFDFSP